MQASLAKSRKCKESIVDCVECSMGASMVECGYGTLTTPWLLRLSIIHITPYIISFSFQCSLIFEQQLFPCVWCDTYHYYHFLWEIDCNIVTLFQRRVAKIFVKFVVLPRAISATQCDCKLLSTGHTIQERFSQQSSNCSLHFSFLASDQIWQMLKAPLLIPRFYISWGHKMLIYVFIY